MQSRRSIQKEFIRRYKISFIFPAINIILALVIIFLKHYYLMGLIIIFTQLLIFRLLVIQYKEFVKRKEVHNKIKEHLENLNK